MLQQHLLSVGHNHQEVKSRQSTPETPPEIFYFDFLHLAFVLTAATAGPSVGHNCQKSHGGRFRQCAQPRPLYPVSTFFFLLIPMGR